MESHKEKTIATEKKPSIFRDTYSLTKESLALIAEDRRIIFFPLVSGVFSVLFLLSFFILNFLFFRGEGQISTGVSVFLAFGVMFIFSFSKVGIAFLFRSYLDHKAITVKEALDKTLLKSQIIFAWSLLSATVCILLLTLVYNDYFVLVMAIFGVYWKLGTYFVIPAMTEEEITLSDALSLSVETLKRGWKQMVIFNLSIEFFYALITIPIVAFLSVFIFMAPVFMKVSLLLSGAVLSIIFLLSLFLVLFAIFAFVLRTSFNTTVYHTRVGSDVKKILHLHR